MICQRCLRRLAQRNGVSSALSSRRNLSQSAGARAQAVTAQTTTATNPRPNDLPAATSTSAAQPFSTPLTPAPKNQGLPVNTAQGKQAAKVQSSVAAGTVLKGLNFMKNQQDPVALEDHEYPGWLWTALNDTSSKGASSGQDAEGDLFSKSKKQRRIAAKALRKEQLLNPDALVPKVPLTEQSIDLPRGDGSLQGAKEAGMARQELTKALREKRRSQIKEDNFLKEMR